MSQYAQAITYFEQALAIARAVQNRAGESTALNNLGIAYQALSQYEQAITYFEQALAIAREVEESGRRRHRPDEPGAAYHALSRYEQALTYFEQARTIFTTWGSGPRRAPSSITWVKSLVR